MLIFFYISKVCSENFDEYKPEWEPNLETDVLSLVLIDARYSKIMEFFIAIGQKNCLSLPSNGWKSSFNDFLKKSRKKNNFKDENMRQFITKVTLGEKL